MIWAKRFPDSFAESRRICYRVEWKQTMTRISQYARVWPNDACIQSDVGLPQRFTKTDNGMLTYLTNVVNTT